MTLFIRQQLVSPELAEKVTAPGINRKTDIAVHETGNYNEGANAAMHANLQYRGNDRKASWHWTVDEHEAVQSFLDDVRCYHAGDGLYGTGLTSSIAVEICVNRDGDFVQTLKNAAELIRMLMEKHRIPIDKVKQHHDYSGKNCPAQLRSGEWGVTWGQFISLIEKGALMINPAVGRVTSEYGMRKHPVTGVYQLHAGIDIAGPKSTPISAAYAGRAKAVGENVVPFRTGRQILIANPDGEGQFYGHLDAAVVKEGDNVKQGQLIGYMGDTGQVTGVHLHFEVWSDANNHRTTRNPRIDERHHGIQFGVGAPVQVEKGRKFLPLAVDGDFSHRSITELERALADTGDYKGWIEEDRGARADFGPVLWTAAQAFLQRHGYYDLELDGIANEGGATKKGFQLWLQDVGHYSSSYKIDGLFGEFSWKALQSALNAGDVRNGRASRLTITTTATTMAPTTTTTTITTAPVTTTITTQPSLSLDAEIRAIATAVVDELARRLSNN